jgi:hypothetical protein
MIKEEYPSVSEKALNILLQFTKRRISFSFGEDTQYNTPVL